MSKIPVIGGSIAGLIHIIVIGTIATKIFVDRGEPPSSELWVFAAWLDLPVYYLSFLFIWLIPHLPHISTLPGIASDWEAFLFPLIWFGVFGTAQWSIVGWAIGKGYVQVVNARSGK